jgi:type II secretory pathway pseudopilin PulG
MNHFHIRGHRDERGFVPSEIPVVVAVAMIIIGVLITIAVPTYLSQRGKAYDAAAKQTARTAALAMETWATEHPGGYDRASLAMLPLTEETPEGNAVTLIYTSARGYEFSVQSGSGNTFNIERAVDGTMTFGCSAGGEAGCPSTGSWN